MTLSFAFDLRCYERDRLGQVQIIARLRRCSPPEPPLRECTERRVVRMFGRRIIEGEVTIRHPEIEAADYVGSARFQSKRTRWMRGGISLNARCVATQLSRECF